MAAKWEASGQRLRPSSKISKGPVVPEQTCLMKGAKCCSHLGEKLVARQTRIQHILEQAVLADQSRHRQPIFKI
eukprot:8642899-Prorocentrum_lima.AAC.1